MEATVSIDEAKMEAFGAKMMGILTRDSCGGQSRRALCT